MKKLIIFCLMVASFAYCARFDYNHNELKRSGLTADELKMFPNWQAADSVTDARFGDLWCDIASGNETCLCGEGQ